MNRFLLLLTVAAFSVFGQGMPSSHATVLIAENCCNECNSCEKSCREYATTYLNNLGPDKPNHRACIKLCHDCADICGTCCRISARGGPLEASICASCAEACEKCAAQCGKNKGHKTCEEYAEQCLKCAKACREKASSK